MAMTYEDAQSQYPCMERRGMGYSGCKCNETYRPDNRLVDCAFHGSASIPTHNCINCPGRRWKNSNNQILHG